MSDSDSDLTSLSDSESYSSSQSGDSEETSSQITWEDIYTEETQPEEIQPEEIQPEEIQPEEIQPEETDSSIETKRDYTCEKCLRRLKKANLFKKHYKESHNVTIFVCRKCPAFFHSVKYLYKHYHQIHSITNSYKRISISYAYHCNHPNCSYMTNFGKQMKLHEKYHRDKLKCIFGLCVENALSTDN